MNEPGKTCLHGIPWADDCRECNLISAREVVRHWGPLVAEAERIIEEAEQEEEKT